MSINKASKVSYDNSLLTRYEKIIEGTDIGTWEWNVQTGETRFNTKWAQIIGYTLTELAPISIETWTNHCHPDDLKRSGQLLEEHFEGKSEAYVCEARMKHKKGHWVWVLDKGKVVSWTADGKPEWMAGSHQEITERINNEILLKQYRELLEKSNEAAGIGSWDVDLLEKNIQWDSVVREIHEVPENFEPNFTNVAEFYPLGENRNLINAANKGAIEHQKTYDVDLQIITQSGKQKWVRAIGIPEFRDGVCIRLFGLFQDIDARIKATKALALEEEQFRQTFKFAPNGMALVALDGTWLKVNKTICDMLGYSKKELLQKTFQDITHPADLQKDLNQLHNLLDNKIDSYQIEKRYFTKTGKIVWANLSVALVKSDQGEPIHFVSQIEDITQKKALMEQISYQNERLLNFAYIVSHNLRSHSANMVMTLDLMKMERPESTDNEYFPLLKKATESLQETVKHLNDVVNINTRKTDDIGTLKLNDFIQSAKDNINALLLQANGEITDEIKESFYVKGFPAYLESVILNFLTNAIKYRSLKRKLSIKLRAHETAENVILEIVDNGKGMNLEKYGDRLFGMYKTFHGNKDARGIGLFITKNQVEAMGGKIDVESKPEVGTTFKIYFARA